MFKPITFFVALSVIGMFYNRYKEKDKKDMVQRHDDIIQQYLLDETPSGPEPIIWIHIPNEINSKKWLHWGSRNTNHLNQSYLYLCIRTIINKANGKFRVCIIDDTTFNKVLPHCKLDLNAMAEPMRTRTRQSLIMQLLYTYGGMSIPLSFIALQNLDDMYAECLSNKDCFVGTCISEYLNSDNIMYNPTFMGSYKNADVMKELIEQYNQLISNDNSAAMDIEGKFQSCIYNHIMAGKIHTITPSQLGVVDRENRVIYIDHLMQSPDLVARPPNMYGLYVPERSLVKRSKYSWYTQIPPQDVLYVNNVISFCLLQSDVSD